MADQAETTSPTNRTKRGRRRLPDHLPRVEIEHTLSDEACRCEHCCSALEPNKQKSTLAAQALKQIQTLYRIEREIKQLSTEKKYTVRHNRSVPILKELRA